jgi:hypothetical protein
MRNHARTVLASDFFVVATVTFRVIYVFVVLEIGTRRILHWNVTEHPNADWTAQQFRMIGAGDQGIDSSSTRHDLLGRRRSPWRRWGWRL